MRPRATENAVAGHMWPRAANCPPLPYAMIQLANLLSVMNQMVNQMVRNVASMFYFYFGGTPVEKHCSIILHGLPLSAVTVSLHYHWRN